jgi:TetR/AcrR family acrAB operon transcriptional repressor
MNSNDPQSRREQARAARKARRHAAREAEILNAASDLLIRYGYDKMTMDDLAEAAHVSKGALYLHFESKQALIDALIQREAERTVADFAQRLSSVQRITLAELFRSSTLALAANPVMRALMNRDRRVLGDYLRRAAQLPIMQQYTSFSADLMRQFQDAGLVRRDMPPEVIAHLLLSLRYGLFVVQDFAPQHQPPPIEQVGEGLVKLLDTGFAAADEPRDETAHAAVDALLEYARRIMDALNRQGSGEEN